MADKLTFVETADGIEGFDSPARAAAYAREAGGKILTGKAAEEHQMRFEADSPTGMLTAAAANSLFGIPKLLIGASGSQALKDKVRIAEEVNPWSGVGGSFLAPWGAASKAVSGLVGGVEAGSVLGKGASIFGEGSVLGEGAIARGAGEIGAGEAAARGIAPVAEEMGSLARPGFAQEAGALAGRAPTAEGAAILEAHPRSFLEAAAREGSLNAGVGAINSAGDYMLSEPYMDGDPHRDAGALSRAILEGALTGGLLGSAAGVVSHGAGKAVDAFFNPANAPKARIPAALRAELEASLRNGGVSAEEAAKIAKRAVEHGIAGTHADAASYNYLSAHLENARVKRGLERGEFMLPPSMTSEADIGKFISEVSGRSHAVRAGQELPSAVEALRGVESDVTQAANERRATLIAEARKPPTPEAAKVWAQNGYGGELSAAAIEAEALGAEKTAALLEKAHGILEKGDSYVARIRALDLMDQALSHAPPGFHLDGERARLLLPLEHEAMGQKFLSALGEHQLAEKTRRELGTLIGQAEAGGQIAQEVVGSAEQAMKGLGLEGGRVDKAVREHYINTAAEAIGAEVKHLSPMLRMLGGLAAGGLASSVMGGFMGGAAGLKAAQFLGKAATDPIAASGVIRKTMVQLNHSAADVERLVQGLAPKNAPKASVMNLVENMTPWGKVLWDTAPGRTARMVGQTLEDGFKALAPSMPQRAAAGMQAAQSIEKHLTEKEPKPVTPIGMNPAAMANLPPRYNDREVALYQTRLQATVNPKAVIANFFATGELTQEAAETLRVAHLLLVREIVAKGAAQMAQAPEGDRPAMARQLEILAGPRGGYFAPSMTPAFVAAVQRGYAQTQPQGPGPGGKSGNASPQKDPGPGGAQFAPATAMRSNHGAKFLQTTHAAPSAALSTNLGSQ